MKYKTFFRIGLKYFGLLLIGSGLTEAVQPLCEMWVQGWINATWWIRGVVILGVKVAAGLYLFFGGKWIANLAIPSNRPYSPECGYDLTGASGSRCPECGTPFSPKDVMPPSPK